MGAVLGWTSPAFDTMSKESSVPRLTDSDDDKSSKTWIGASMTLGALVGALISGSFFLKPFFLINKGGFTFQVQWLNFSVAKRRSLPILFPLLLDG